MKQIMTKKDTTITNNHFPFYFYENATKRICYKYLRIKCSQKYIVLYHSFDTWKQNTGIFVFWSFFMTPPMFMHDTKNNKCMHGYGKKERDWLVMNCNCFFSVLKKKCFQICKSCFESHQRTEIKLEVPSFALIRSTTNVTRWTNRMNKRFHFAREVGGRAVKKDFSFYELKN